MRKLLLLVLLAPLSALAQFGPSDDSDTFGGDLSDEYFNFSRNHSMFGAQDVFNGGLGYDNVFYGWNGFDEDDEPIDEIIVTAKRRVDRGWELWLFIDWNFDGTQVCANYSDGGTCTHYDTFYDPELIPIAGGCQSMQGTLGPLTGQEANDLNVEYLNEQALGSAIITAGATGIGALVGGGAGALIGAAGGVVTTINGFVGELPFTAGDTVEWTLDVCNDGAGGVDSSLGVTIG